MGQADMQTSSGLPGAEETGITRAAGTIGLATLLSRILGFVRDMVLASMFGASLSADAFYVAFRIPSMLRELFAEGSMSAGFVPVFSEYLTRRSKEEARQLAHAAFSLLLLALILITLLGIWLAPGLVALIAPGFRNIPEKFQLTSQLTRIMFPYLLFIGLAALSMGILNSLRSFAVPALSPALFNLSVIGMALLVAPAMTDPIIGVALGILVGGLAQWLVQWPVLQRQSMSLRFRWDPSHEGIRRIGLLLVPVLLGLSVSQINIFFNTLFASFLREGSVTYLYYGMRLVHFPLGIFGVALATAILPALSAQAARRADDELRETISYGLRLVFFITVPAMVGLILLRVPIIHLLFEHGAFNAQDTQATAGALVGYAVGLWAFAGVRIVASAFYALQDTRTPVRIAIVAVAANILLSLALMPVLQHVGLALAASLASVLNLGLLLWSLRTRMVSLDWVRIRCSGLRVLTASAVMGMVCLWFSRREVWLLEGQWWEKSWVLGSGIVVSGAIYFLVHRLMGSEELSSLQQILRQKITTGENR